MTSEPFPSEGLAAKSGHVTVVTGLPRSGTSMMMAMLRAGGMPLVTDNVRHADAHNPRGYFEYQPARSLRNDHAWLLRAHGHAVKVISFHLYDLPGDGRFDLLFMVRDLREVVASQLHMLADGPLARPQICETEIALLARHLDHVRDWLAKQPYIRVHYIPYRGVLEEPVAHASAIATFLSRPLDRNAMASTVTSELYHQRHSPLE